MRICVVGCGAVGGIFAAHLARLDGVEVYALDVHAAHMAAIRESGLRVSGAAEFTARLAGAATDPLQIPRCDFGLVATKSIHTRAAMERAKVIFGDESAVCSVQNGVGNEEIIAEHARYVIRGTTFPAGHLIAPGHVGFDIPGDTWIGPFEPTGTPMEKVRALGDALTRAGMNTFVLADARGAQWTKLIFNAATNPVGGLTRLHHGAAAQIGRAHV